MADSKTKKGISSWPEEERPRERLLKRGAEALTDEEHFRVLYLNRRNVLLSDILISRGEAAKVHISLRQIVSNALQVNASAIIAAHNHPSGDTEPSESDRLLTKDLIAATRPLNIKVLDHLVVGGEEFYSFADKGLLDELELECLAPGTTERAV